MTDLRELHFFATPEHSCSYIEGLKAKTLFVDPQTLVSNTAYSQLSDLGFRRSGKHIYRPHCDGCRACISVRVPVDLFTPNKTQKRILNRNRDIQVRMVKPTYTEPYFNLYSDYICARHADGDMFPPTKDQFNSFLVEGNQETYFYEYLLDDELIGLSVVDHLEQGLSATYTFYNPSEAYQKRSLGTFAILWQIQETLARKQSYLYLGYWVKECRKMRYKISYRPLEFLIDGQWILVR